MNLDRIRSAMYMGAIPAGGLNNNQLMAMANSSAAHYNPNDVLDNNVLMNAKSAMEIGGGFAFGSNALRAPGHFNGGGDGHKSHDFNGFEDMRFGGSPLKRTMPNGKPNGGAGGGFQLNQIPEDVHEVCSG